jgi:hypothetical protein
MTAEPAWLRPPKQWEHLPYHFLKAKDGHFFVALWQSDEWWSCGRESPCGDQFAATGTTYSHPCTPDAVVPDPEAMVEIVTEFLRRTVGGYRPTVARKIVAALLNPPVAG